MTSPRRAGPDNRRNLAHWARCVECGHEQRLRTRDRRHWPPLYFTCGHCGLIQPYIQSIAEEAQRAK